MKYPPSDHYDGKRFHNLQQPKRTFLDVIKWQLTSQKAKWPEKRPIQPRENLAPAIDNALEITFINHSTLLIQWNQLNILTDPIWSNRASPFSWMGPKRRHEPGIPFHKLPPIHIVLISHNHYDHLDLPTLHLLKKAHDPLFLTTLGNQAYLAKHGIPAHELDWWQTFPLDGWRFTLTPAEHFSARWPWNVNKTLWGGFLVQNSHHSLYFAGDTAYGSLFKEIYQRYGSPQVALLPIGAFEPRWFMQAAHMNPEDALKAHYDLHATHSIGIHHSAFHLSDEAIDTPAERIRQHGNEDFITLKPGEFLRI